MENEAVSCDIMTHHNVTSQPIVLYRDISRHAVLYRDISRHIMLCLAVPCCTALSYRDIRYRDLQIPTPPPPLTAMGKRPKGRSRLPLKGNAMGVACGSPALFFAPNMAATLCSSVQ